jgi:glycosyltransferase involved in cell wall biosynthesis
MSRTSRKLARVLGIASYERQTTRSYLTAFRRHSPDVVLAEYGPSGVNVMEACREAGVPLVVHFHGFDASVRTVLRENAATYPRLFRLAAAIVAVSQPMRRTLMALGALPAKVHYNPYGVDCQAFDGAAPACAAPVLLAVGRFVEKKAPQSTIAAFAGAYRACPQARLRMIGDGPLLAPCGDLVHRLGLGDAVQFLGAQPPAIVRAEMRQARAFVQHSVEAPSGDSEGLPVGILEAGASGLPVVATRHAGIPEAVLDRETGFLVDEGDVAGMAAAMWRLLEVPALAGQLGRRAREWVSTYFSMEHSIQGLWAILRSCLPSPAPSGQPTLPSAAEAGAELAAPASAQVRPQP